jgi:hypothetical protein
MHLLQKYNIYYNYHLRLQITCTNAIWNLLEEHSETSY